MLRAYLVIIVVIGVAASLMSGRDASPQRPHAQQVHVVDAASLPSDPSFSDMAANLDGAVELKRETNGHFYADVLINGAPVRMLVDTGATGIALSRDDARKAGIATSIGMNEVVGEGADGSIHGEFVMIDRIALGPKTAEQMPAMVLNSGERSLLGQQFLQKFAAVEIHGDTMTLR